MNLDTKDVFPNQVPTAASAGGHKSHTATPEVLHSETAHPEDAVGSSHTGHPAETPHDAADAGSHIGHDKAGHHEEAH